MNVFYPVQWSIAEKKEKKKKSQHTNCCFHFAKIEDISIINCSKVGRTTTLAQPFFLLLYSCEKKQKRGKYFLRTKNFHVCQVIRIFSNFRESLWKNSQKHETSFEMVQATRKSQVETFFCLVMNITKLAQRTSLVILPQTYLFGTFHLHKTGVL